MKKQQFLFVFFAVGMLVGCAGCAFSGEEAVPPSGSLAVMTWNIHNLFDGEDNGNEYEEFLQSSGWSAEKYLGRVNTISDAIGRINPQPDVIMFQEVESQKILEDLAFSLQRDFLWNHFAVNPGSAIGLGIISRYPLLEIKAHSISINGDTAPRPVLEARIQAAQDFVVFVCHWKSKLGGNEATENTRKAAARVILRRIRELNESEPDTGFIVAGDLNQNHDEFYRQNASMICALLPDDPYCASITAGVQKDFFVISKNRPPSPIHFPKETIIFYSPWTSELENGSYFYRNSWETIDHFLVSGQFFDNTGWEYEKTMIVNIAPFANANGKPTPYNSRTGLGLSDHLPLLLIMNMRE